MDVKLLNTEKKVNRISFLLKDVSPMLANVLRRSIINEVPTMAIEDVEFRKNNSALYDEIVAHRLGLVPLKTDLKSYIPITECTCNGEGCAKCSVKLILKFKASSNGMVNASELQSADPKIVPVYPEMPIAKLLKGQQIEFEATAVLGRGKKHTKWSPGHAWFKHMPEVEIAGKIDNPEKLAHMYPKLFEYKAGKLTINKDAILESNVWDEVQDVTQGAVKYTEHPTAFIFYVESWGQLKPKDMAVTAMNIFEEKLDHFIDAIEGKTTAKAAEKEIEE